MKIADKLRYAFGFVNQALATAKNTAYVSLENARRAAVLLIANEVGAGSTITVQWQEAQDSSGTGVQNVGDPEVITISGTETDKLAVSSEIRADQLSEGFTHVRASVVEAGSPTPGFTASAAMILGENRFNP